MLTELPLDVLHSVLRRLHVRDLRNVLKCSKTINHLLKHDKDAWMFRVLWTLEKRPEKVLVSALKMPPPLDSLSVELALDLLLHHKRNGCNDPAYDDGALNDSSNQFKRVDATGKTEHDAVIKCLNVEVPLSFAVKKSGHLSIHLIRRLAKLTAKQYDAYGPLVSSRLQSRSSVPFLDRMYQDMITALNTAIEEQLDPSILNDGLLADKETRDLAVMAVYAKGTMSPVLLTCSCLPSESGGGDEDAACAKLVDDMFRRYSDLRDAWLHTPQRISYSSAIINSCTPLMSACRNGRVRMVSVLLSYGADMLEREASLRWTALHYACYGGCIDCIQMVLAEMARRLGCDSCQEARRVVDEASLSVGRYTTLQALIANTHLNTKRAVKCAAFLIEELGADPTVKKDGRTAFTLYHTVRAESKSSFSAGSKKELYRYLERFLDDRSIVSLYPSSSSSSSDEC